MPHSIPNPDEDENYYIGPIVGNTNQYSYDFAYLGETNSTGDVAMHLNGRLNEYIATTQAEQSPKSKKPQLNSEEVKILRNATQDLMDARQDCRRHMRPQADRREREYINLIQGDEYRNRTARQIFYSEHPVYLAHLDYEVLKEMIPMSRGFLDYQKYWKVICSKTNREIPLDYAFVCMGNVYGADAVPTVEMCACCEYVRIDCKSILDTEGKLIFLCQKCLRADIRCGLCAERLTDDSKSGGVCIKCIQIPSIVERPFRRFGLNKKWCSDKPGSIMVSPRVYSFEIETLVKSSTLVNLVGDRIPFEAGMSTDSSIQGNGKGIEIQSPRLQGVRGEEFTTRVAGVLKDTKATVNASCGMHVHIDATGILPISRKFYPAALVDLWKAYVVFEDVIFSVLPYNRRINRYCRPLRDYFKLSEIEMITSIYDAERLWYKQQDSDSIRSEKQHHHHASRYFGVNFHSLFAGGHLELRHHSGTLNAKKVLQWANLHALIMDAAVKGVFTTDFISEAQATTNLKDKTKMLFEHIGLAVASQRYFHERQNKFNDKSQEEDGLVPVQSQPRRAEFESRIQLRRANFFTDFNQIEL